MPSLPLSSAAPGRATLRKDLYHITTDGFFYCAMLGIAEMYFAKFILALKLGQVASGLIMTLPLMLGALLSLAGPALLRRVGSFPRFIALVAAVQGLMLFPLGLCAILAPFVLPGLAEHGLTWLATTLIFLLITLYFFGALATAAPWVTITGELVPGSIRANYNARRLRLLQAATLGALLLHGLIADAIVSLFAKSPPLAATGLDPTLCGFALCFFLGGIFRLISCWHLLSYSTPRSLPHEQLTLGTAEFLRRFKHGNDGRFLLYLLAANFAIQISQPYTNPFMLEHLRFSGQFYEWMRATIGVNAPYSLLLAAVYLGRILALPIAGNWAKKHSSLRLLWIGSILLIPMAIFWLFTSRFELILLGQIISGAAFGIWELAVLLMNYDTIKPAERNAMITYSTLANESSKTSGSFLGGGLLAFTGNDGPAYTSVFCLSAAARIALLFLLARIHAPARHPPAHPTPPPPNP